VAAPGAVMVSSTADSSLRTSLDAPGSDSADRLSDVDVDVDADVDVDVDVDAVGRVKRAGEVTVLETTLDDCVTVNAVLVGEEVKASEMLLLLERLRHTATKAKLEMRNMVVVV